MPEKPRLLYLIGQFPAINHGYLLAEIRHLRKLGFEIFVASISAPDRTAEKLSPEEREEAERTYYVKSASLANAALQNVAEFLTHPLRYLRGLIFSLRLAGLHLKAFVYHLAYFAEAVLVGRQMRKLNVTHVHASFSTTVALLAERTFPITMSFAVYGFGELYDPAGTHLAQKIDHAVFVRSISRYGRGQLMLACDRTAWPKLICAPLGINPAEYKQRSPQPFSSPAKLLCVGRLAPEKGQGLLLDAIAAISAVGSCAHLRFVGDGPDREWLERRAHELGIASSITFEGWVTQERLAEIYGETELFVLPSLAEGIPMVLMEAMAQGIPCVAPKIAGIPELIADGEEGILFAVGDVEELIEAIRRALASPDLCERVSAKARQKVLSSYDAERNTGRFARVFEKFVFPKPEIPD